MRQFCLVAAVVIRTVSLAPTFTDIGVFAAVILTRAFLSGSLAVEMEGRWPWQPKAIYQPLSNGLGGER
jgi:hypothetical protein